MKRDFQRSKVYRWAHNYVWPMDYEYLDLKQCENLIVDVLRVFNFNNTELTLKPMVANRKYGSFNLGNRVIKISQHGQIRPVVLHEVAHFLNHYYYGRTVPAHGKEFVGFYMSLLNKWSRIPISELQRTAEINKVQYINPKLMPKLRSKLNLKPKNSLKNKYIVTKLAKYIPENGIFKLMPGKYSGYQIQYYE